MIKVKEFPVLYILMRTDMHSMNAGKGMAQASHASNAFVKKANEQFDEVTKVNIDLFNIFETWQTSTPQGFGTAIVLQANQTQIDDLFNNIISSCFEDDCIMDKIIDPSYPIKDGYTTHHLSVMTCAYVFCDRNSVVGNLMQKFSLHN